MKKVIVWIFLGIIFAPIVLSCMRKLTDVKFDVNLKGYSNSVERPGLSADTLLDGTFQSSFGAWFEEKMALRGVLTTTYNTVRYEAFHLGNRPIGNNGSIFEGPYLDVELSLGEYDYSVPENAQNIRNMVAHMDSVNEKLNKMGKYFYVYIAPSKADVHPEDMPDNYVVRSRPGAVNAVDLFKKEISVTDVPYLICSDMLDELEYPAFYSTGIHWSRTYEQLTSQKIISELSKLSGGNYRNIEFTGVESGKKPFWRDSDVYDLLNVWFYPDIDYYQYTVKTTESESAAPMHILLWGDSFSEGLEKDIEENIAEDFIYYIRKKTFAKDPDGTEYSIEGDWEDFDWQSYLDRTDFVVMEMTEPEVVNYTYGFIEYLDSYLDSYVPMPKGTYYVSELDANNEETWNTSSSAGIWGREDGYAWIKPNCNVAINNKSISDNGLEIDFSVPDEVFDMGEPELVEIRINGTVVYKETYTYAVEEQVIIKPEEFVLDEDDNYIITISCSQYFNPLVRGYGPDDRDLALRLKYVGGVR